MVKNFWQVIVSLVITLCIDNRHFYSETKNLSSDAAAKVTQLTCVVCSCVSIVNTSQ